MSTKNRVLIITQNTKEQGKLVEAFQKENWEVECEDDASRAAQLLLRYPARLVVSESDSDLRTAENLVQSYKEKTSEELSVILLVNQSIDERDFPSIGCDAVYTRPVDGGAVLSEARRLLEPPESRAKRSTDRIPCEFPIVLKHQGTDQIISSKIQNLGYTGMFILQAGAKLPQKFQTFSFAFRIEPDNIEITGKGLVRWLKKDPTGSQAVGFGIEFYIVDGNGMQAIHDWVKARITTPKGEQVF
jgi:hypothetical protein